MKIIVQALLIVFGLVVSATAAEKTPPDKGARVFSAQLTGFNEVHFVPGPPAALRGAILTKATGSFSATLNNAGDSISYELTYRDLEGDVTQAHIHFGQPSTVGGIVVWLCQTAASPAPSEVASFTPQCPEEGTVKGTIIDDQVLPQTLQGVTGQFNELVRALRAETAYANVHSSIYPQGEIRGQINVGRLKGR